MALEFKVEVVGLDSLLADVRRAGGNAKPLVTAALSNAAGKIQSTAREKAPHRTGNLQRSILKEISYPEATVSVNEKYGLWVEQGTGLYGPRGQRITPRSAKVLAWSTDGGMAFARWTRGMRARPYFKPAIEATREYVRSQFSQVTDRLVRELAGRA